MLPYRTAAPPEPDAPETEEPYAAVLRAQRRRARIACVVGVVVAAGAIAKVARSGPRMRPRPPLARMEVDEARSVVLRAKSRAFTAQDRFERAVREAIGSDVRPRADLGPCPITLPAPTTLIADRPSFPLLTLDRVEIGSTLPSQAVAEVLVDIGRATDHIAHGRYEEAALYARALDRSDRFGYDVVLVARESKEPRAIAASAYEPGAIEGRAYLYDFASGKVICAADVSAKSSDAIGYAFADRADAPARFGPTARMADALRADLRLQTERAITTAMRFRAGPPTDD